MGRLKNLKPRITAIDARLPVTTINPDSWRTDKLGANARGYTYRWQIESKAFLRAHPLCQCDECDEGRLRTTIATVVDHHIPHRGDMQLFWDQTNWRAMAKQCHDSKTQQEGKGG